MKNMTFSIYFISSASSLFYDFYAEQPGKYVNYNATSPQTGRLQTDILSFRLLPDDGRR